MGMTVSRPSQLLDTARDDMDVMLVQGHKENVYGLIDGQGTKSQYLTPVPVARTGSIQPFDHARSAGHDQGQGSAFSHGLNQVHERAEKGTGYGWVLGFVQGYDQGTGHAVQQLIKIHFLIVKGKIQIDSGHSQAAWIHRNAEFQSGAQPAWSHVRATS